MKNFTSEKNCDCPLDCDSITYSYSLVSSRLKEDELCTGNQKNPTPLLTDFYKKPFPSFFIRQLSKYAKNISADALEICNKYLKYRAVVIFRLATNDVSVTVTSRRLSFFDKLSGFGEIWICQIYSKNYMQVEYLACSLAWVFWVWWKLFFGLLDILCPARRAVTFKT